MKITVNNAHADIKVMAFEGNLETTSAPEAEQKINALIEKGVKNILINFENLNYISSAGLRVLLTTAKQLKFKQGMLCICSLNETVAEVFEMTGFTNIFNIFKTEAEALKHF